jgi:hypothetical protein
VLTKTVADYALLINIGTTANGATKDSDNPDVRDKAYVYWRLLSTDPAAAKVRTHSSDLHPASTDRYSL